MSGISRIKDVARRMGFVKATPQEVGIGNSTAGDVLLWGVGQDMTPPASAQVVVYGATTWGLVAAIAAARQGMDVVVIEPSYHVGGMVTSNLRTDWRGYSFGLVSSITAEYYRLVAAKAGLSPMDAMLNDQFSLPNQPYVLALADLVAANKIRIYTGWRVVESAAAVLKGASQDVIGLTLENATDTSRQAVIRCLETITADPEGDVMARAGVSYIIGRESSAQYGEANAGVTAAQVTFTGIDPYIVPGNAGSGLLPGIEATTLEAAGSADNRVMAYTYRFNVTNDPAKKKAWWTPKNPNALTHEFAMRWLEQNPTKTLHDIVGSYSMRAETVGAGYIVEGWNAKLAIGSINAIGKQHDYANLTYAQRAARDEEHREHIALLFYKLQTDPRVPVAIKTELATFGPLADDAYDSNGFSPCLYRREVRRMVGRRVLTQSHADSSQVMPDPIAWGIYTMDVHYVSLRGGTGTVVAEGSVGNVGVTKPYLIGRGVVLPKASEAQRLQVIGTPSASHMGWSSLRIDCTLMSLAEAAGVAAALAIKSGRRSGEISGAEISQYTGFKRSPKYMMFAPGTANLTNGQVIAVTGGSILVGGAWTASTFGFGAAGDRTFDDQASSLSNHILRYIPSFPDGPGLYKIGVHIPPVSSNSTTARVRLRTAEGYYDLQIDQRNGDLLFAGLGVFPFAADGTEWFEVSNLGAGGYVRGDGGWYERVGDAPAVTFSGLGANIATNGGFDADANWTKSTGWTITGGKAVATNLAPGNSLIQNCGMANGSTYEVTFDVAGLSGGALQCTVSGGQASPAITANGTYRFLMTPSSTSGNVTFAAATGTVTATIDNVTVKLVTPL